MNDQIYLIGSPASTVPLTAELLHNYIMTTVSKRELDTSIRILYALTASQNLMEPIHPRGTFISSFHKETRVMAMKYCGELRDKLSAHGEQSHRNFSIIESS